MKTATRIHPKTLAKLQADPQPCAQGDGPREAKPIVCIGGPLNGQKRADNGENQRVFDGEVYRRVHMDVGNCACGRMQFYVLGYFGHEWDS